MTDSINTRFAKAWESVANPPLDSVNPHFKNKFASLNATLKVIREACAKNDIVYVQSFAYVPGDEPTFVIRTCVLDSQGGHIDLSTMYFPITDNPQQLGSAMTYCRRYAAQLDWGIVGEEDDDAERAMPQQPQKAQPAPNPKPKQAKKPKEKDALAELWQECIDLGVKPEGLMSWYETQGFGGMKLSQLTAIERKQVEAYLLDMRESIKQVNKL